MFCKKSIIATLFLIIILFQPLKAQWIRKAPARGVSLAETIARDNAGNIFSAGTFVCDLIVGTDTLRNQSCDPVLPPPVPYFDGYIVKYDPDGNYIWSRQIKGSAGNEVFEVKDVATDNAGNCFITGSYKGTLDFSGTTITNTSAQADMFIAKYLANGSFQWVRSNYARRSQDSIIVNAISTDGAGSCLVAGAFINTIVVNGDADTLSSPNQELFIAKLNGAGNFEWLIKSQGDSVASSAEIRDLKVDADANLFVTGVFRDTVDFNGLVLHTVPQGSTRLFVGKYNSNGQALWVLQENVTSASSLALSPFGEKLFVAGNFKSSAVVGGTAYNTTAGNTAAVVAQYDTSGNYNWSRICTVRAVDSAATAYGVTTDDQGSCYLTGSFGKNGVNAPVISSGGVSESGIHESDIFVAKYTDDGTVRWIQVLGDNGTDLGKDIVAGDSLNVYITGSFSSRIRIDSQEVVNDYPNFNAFTAELDPCPFYRADIAPVGRDTICAGDSLLITALTGPGFSYQWMKDETDIPGATGISYYASEPGVYRVKITAPSLACEKYSLALTLVVNPLPAKTVTASGTRVFCEGGSVALTGSFGYTYQWLNNNVIIPGATAFNYTATTSGDYRLVLRNSFGCVDTSDVQTVTVYPYPDAPITPLGKFVICTGDSVTMSTDAIPGYKYQWYKDNNILAADTFAVYKAKTDGVYKVRVSNQIGCATISQPDTVSTMNSPPATITSNGALEFCADNPTTLYANSGLGLTYQWMLNGVVIPSATDNIYMPSASGIYTVSVKNAINCVTQSDPVNIIVNPQPVATLTAGITTICSGDSVRLTGPVAAGYVYRWQKNNADIIDEAKYEYYAKTSGSYRLILTDDNACSDTSEVISVAVNGRPTATLVAKGATSFCVGDSVELVANSGTGLTYQWYKDGSLFSGLTGVSGIVKQQGVYKVVVTNLANCSTESEPVSVTVFSNPPAVITPDGPVEFCAGSSVTLLAGQGTGYQYQWIKDGFDISGATGASYNVVSSGNYAVKVSLSSTCASTSAIQQVVVKPNLKPTLTVNTTFVSTAFFGSYQWYKDGVAIAGANHQIYNASESGQYSVSIINEHGCQSASDPVTICVPYPFITVSGTLLKASSGASYQWYLEGFQIDGATSQNYLAQASGNYKVKVRDEEGCESFSEEVLVCVAAPFITVGTNNVLMASHGISFQWYLDGVEIPGANTQLFVPEVSGKYTVQVENEEHCISVSLPVSITVAGMNQIFENGSISIFPNPAHNLINLRINSPVTGEVKATVFNALGIVYKEFICQKYDNELEMQIDIQEAESGLYYLKIESGEYIYHSKFEKINGW
ncbi:MAG TPA: T9SS type A sorting domain-containing protein [Cytophagaceae bacterium]